MMDEPMTFQYDATPAATEREWFKEGATKGYLVYRWAGLAWVADAVVLRDEEGIVAIEQTSDLVPTEIVES